MATADVAAVFGAQAQRHGEGLGEVFLGEGLGDRAGGNQLPVAQQHRVGESRGDLFEVVGDQHHGGGFLVVGQFAQARHQVLAAGKVQPGPGLVEQEQFRVGHQRAGDLHALAFTLGEGDERAVDHGGHAPVVQQLEGTTLVELLVGLAPASGHAVGRGQHHVEHRLVLRDVVGQGRGGQADARAQLEDVDGSEHLAQHAGNTARGVHARTGDLQQRGFSGAVGPEYDPPLTLFNLPVDVRQ